MIAQLTAAVLGAALMYAPHALGYSGTPAATSHRVVGPLIVAFAIVACWSATRSVRHWYLPAAAWLGFSPLLIPHAPDATAASIMTGLTVAACSRLGGNVDMEKHYAGGWRALFRRQRLNQHQDSADNSAGGA